MGVTETALEARKLPLVDSQVLKAEFNKNAHQWQWQVNVTG
jgi:hypothetical protein